MKNLVSKLFLMAAIVTLSISSCSTVQEHEVIAQNELKNSESFHSLILSVATIFKTAIDNNWASNTTLIQSELANLNSGNSIDLTKFQTITGISFEDFYALQLGIGNNLVRIFEEHPFLKTMSASERSNYFSEAVQENDSLMQALMALNVENNRCFLQELCTLVGTFIADIVHDFMCENGWADICEGGFDGDLLGAAFDNIILVLCGIFPC
jgi:hypothetical protein